MWSLKVAESWENGKKNDKEIQVDKLLKLANPVSLAENSKDNVDFFRSEETFSVVAYYVK